MRGANGNNATHSVSTHVSFPCPFRLRLVTGLKKWAQTPKVMSSIATQEKSWQFCAAWPSIAIFGPTQMD